MKNKKSYEPNGSYVKDVFYKLLFTTNIKFKLFNKIKSFLEQGVPILDVLTELKDAYKSLNKLFDVRVYILEKIIYSMNIEAKSLSDSLVGWASPSEIMLIKSGEEGGRMVEAMENTIVTTRASKDAIATVRKKLAYPFFLIVILFGMAYLFATQVVPEFERFTNPNEWPSGAQKLHAISEIVREKWGLIIGGFFGSLFILKWSLSNITGPIRRKLDKTPLFSMYRSFQSSMFLVSLSSMVKSGVDLEYSLQKIRRTSPKYMKYELGLIANRLDSGMTIGDAFNTEFFDEESRIDIGIYAKSKNIGESIEVIGKEAILNGVEKISAAADTIKILVMLLLVFYIGWSYMSFYSLIQSISQTG
ncbi:type II secretion system F family protein [Pseudoalteromonas sp. OFAV1]|jgi:type II secretory pathway component PulF|uniref:type II secretion system F family protein n=1 Tax=Pseudoalteromonas sp. OFAV1 TaxID=2908892 RepID=UPI001F1A4203|nr:type II secretion system F family protein [Pseudoalteromonas sp. OFAV1]MCF2901216.1 type II secretion system F family protein [Pseudoalteromonas sp. OFAV1]